MGKEVDLVLAGLRLLWARKQFERIGHALAAATRKDCHGVSLRRRYAQPFQIVTVLGTALGQNAVREQRKEVFRDVDGPQLGE